MSVRGALVVFARAPRPGEVKTRLCPPFSPDEAAALYAALLADVLDTTAGLCRRLGLEPVVTVHPARACAEIAGVAPPTFRVIGQRGASLAARMGWAVGEAAASGASPILLRGSDSPLLDEEIVSAALDALAAADLVVSPDRDGGYNLVGLKRPVAGIFDHAMSTSTVLSDTLANARAAGAASPGELRPRHRGGSAPAPAGAAGERGNPLSPHPCPAAGAGGGVAKKTRRALAEPETPC